MFVWQPRSGSRSLPVIVRRRAEISNPDWAPEEWDRTLMRTGGLPSHTSIVRSRLTLDMTMLLLRRSEMQKRVSALPEDRATYSAFRFGLIDSFPQADHFKNIKNYTPSCGCEHVKRRAKIWCCAIILGDLGDRDH